MLKFENDKLEKTVVDGILNINYSDSDVFKNGTDINIDTFKEVGKYQKQYLEEATKFAANIAKEDMVNDEKIEKVIVNFPFGISTNGRATVNVARSKTFPGINGTPPVTKSTVTVVTKDPMQKISKSCIKDIEADLTALLIK